MKVFLHSATKKLASFVQSLINDFVHNLVIALLSFPGKAQVVAICVETALSWCMGKGVKWQDLRSLCKGQGCQSFLNFRWCLHGSIEGSKQGRGREIQNIPLVWPNS